MLYGTSSTDLTNVAASSPPLPPAPNPTLPPFRSVMLTNPAAPGADPVAWYMVAARAEPLVIWWSFLESK